MYKGISGLERGKGKINFSSLASSRINSNYYTETALFPPPPWVGVDVSLFMLGGSQSSPRRQPERHKSPCPPASPPSLAALTPSSPPLSPSRGRGGGGERGEIETSTPPPRRPQRPRGGNRRSSLSAVHPAFQHFLFSFSFFREREREREREWQSIVFRYFFSHMRIFRTYRGAQFLLS